MADISVEGCEVKTQANSRYYFLYSQFEVGVVSSKLDGNEYGGQYLG